MDGFDEPHIVNPYLPQELEALRLRLRYRGHSLHFDLRGKRMSIAAPDGWAGPDRIRVRDTVLPFRAGERLEIACHLEDGGCRPVPSQMGVELAGREGGHL